MNPATRSLIVDDAHSDIKYHGRWKTKSDSSMQSQPDSPYRGSYHILKGVKTPKGNLSFAFSGSSVVAYGVQAPTNYSEKERVFKCKVDGQEITPYPEGQEKWNSMHQPLCGTDTLADGPHVFDLLISFPELGTSNYSLSFDSLAYVPSGSISTSDDDILINHTDPEIRSALSPNSWKLVPGLGYMAADNSSYFKMAFIGESLECFGFYLANVSSTADLIGSAWSVDGRPFLPKTRQILHPKSRNSDLLLFRTERYKPGEHTLLVKGSDAVGAQLTLSYVVVNTGSIASSLGPLLPSSSSSSSSFLLPPTLIPNQANLPITGRQVPNMHIGEILGSILGGLFLSIIAALWLLRVRQVRRRIRSDQTIPEPFEAKQQIEHPTQGIIRFPFFTSPLMIPPVQKQTSQVNRMSNERNLPADANEASTGTQRIESSPPEYVQHVVRPNGTEDTIQTRVEHNRERVVAVHADGGVRLCAIPQNTGIVELPPTYVA